MRWVEAVSEDLPEVPMDPSLLDQVLDPVDRASEAIGGIIMALGITGSISVATAGSHEIRTLLFGAVGGILATGITDAVMYLVGALTEQDRRKNLLLRLQGTHDASEAHRLIAKALPERLAGGASEATLEAIRKRLVAIPVPRTVLQASDYAAAMLICLVVVLATLPVTVPFLLIHDPRLAMTVSRGLAFLDLFACGIVLGHYSGGNTWKYGVGITAIGVVLVLVISALGG
jgi:VIT1/CCC1 family predicted Fe2+/Mn2+ transporter